MSTRRGWRRLIVLLTAVYVVAGCATAALVYFLLRYSQGHAMNDAPRNWALFTLATYALVYAAAWAAWLAVRWVIRGFRTPD